jgi:hypothetical protein
MKNVHLIPTDKPSRLHYYSFKGFAISKEALKWKEAHHIYINSDEEIKEENYGYDQVHKCAIKITKNLLNNYLYKKIILTTDQDLIQDGVQAIDDEFLEWFVKNPSCEEVEFQRWYDGYKFGYKIIVPQEEPKVLTKLEIAKNIVAIGIGKEEPKQETFGESIDKSINIISMANSMFGHKQETLEEFINQSNTPEGLDQFSYDKGLEDGAKWQKERMYSEEDMIQFSAIAHLAMIDPTNNKSFEELFEQFKKK